MRLREMTLSGIGPFRGTEYIDFTDFEASGLFLLEGPTGAGKSTIIDAVTFALYGDVARQKDSSKDRLRSSYCEPSEPSLVDLVFEVPTGLYRVHRSPQFLKPGRKAPVSSTVHLERVVEDGNHGFTTVEQISRSVGEADVEITRLIGLTKEQFLQTVVLPQGKFAGFLTAKSEDRQAILSTIFDTGIFERLQQVLRDRAHEADAALHASRTSVLEAFGALRRATAIDEADTSPNLTDTEPEPDLEDPDSLLAVADAAVEAVHLRAEDHAQAVGPVSRRAEEAATALARAQATEDALSDRERHLERLEELTAESPQIEAIRKRLADARRAEPVRSSLDRDRRARLALDEAEAALLHECARAIPHRDDLDEARTLADLIAGVVLPSDSGTTIELRERMRHLHETVLARRGSVSAMLEIESGLTDRRTAVEDEQKALDALDARLHAARERDRTLPEEIARMRAQVEADGATAAGLETLLTHAENLNRRLDAARRADLLRASLAGRADDLRAAAQRAQLAGAVARDAHDRWLHSTAASLSVALVEGQACPVCGSEHHPAPAPEPEGGAIDLEDVDALAEKQRQADRALEAARADHTDAVRQIASLNEQAGADSATLTAQAAESQGRIEVARAAADRVASGRSSIADLTDQWTQVRTELAELSRDSVEAHTRIDATRDRLEADRLRCVEAASPLESLAALDRVLTGLLTHIDDLLDALDTHDRGLREASAARTDLELVVERAGFPPDDAGIARVREALLDPDDMADLDSRVTRHDQAVRAVREALDSPRLREVADADHPDLEALRANADREKQAQAQALRVAGQWESRESSAHAARTDFAERLDALTTTGAAAAPVRRLAGLAAATSPENLVQTPLASWVLVSRFEEVLAAANPRLLEISEGRYELHLTLSDDTRSRKAGLGLEILDHDTDEARAPRTLSGGETFYVSLALALGLADVVTAEAGGIELRTMFIDEGFGSLDTGKLDTVMAQLGALRDSGRTVGVISHVDEMARRIPDQINVRWNSRTGSTLSVRA